MRFPLESNPERILCTLYFGGEVQKFKKAKEYEDDTEKEKQHVKLLLSIISGEALGKGKTHTSELFW